MSEGIPLNNIVVYNPKVHHEPYAKMADRLTHGYIGTIVPLRDQSPTWILSITMTISHTIGITINMMIVLMYLNLHRGGDNVIEWLNTIQ
jgi:hypothetical protein